MECPTTRKRAPVARRAASISAWKASQYRRSRVSRASSSQREAGRVERATLEVGELDDAVGTAGFTVSVQVHDEAGDGGVQAGGAGRVEDEVGVGVALVEVQRRRRERASRSSASSPSISPRTSAGTCRSCAG
jgi:hypothetical protein